MWKMDLSTFFHGIISTLASDIRLSDDIRCNPSGETLYLARCGRCFLKSLCGQCPGKSWMEHGTLGAPVEYLYVVAHARAQGLGVLKEGERAYEVDDWRERVKTFRDGICGG